MNKWIAKGDTVLVLSGNDRGKVGEVLSRQKDRILVQGINVRKRHMKRRSEDTKSEIVSMEKPIHISNVALADKDGKKIKVNVKTEKDGAKSLVYKKGSKNETFRVLKKGSK